jgi:hypothetical protein
MLRPSAMTWSVKSPSSGNNSGLAGTVCQSNSNSSTYGYGSYDSKYTKASRRLPTFYPTLFFVTSLMFGMIVRNNMILVNTASNTPRRQQPTAIAKPEDVVFAALRNRAVVQRQHCHSLGLSQAQDFRAQRLNNHTAHLPQSGIIQAIDQYYQPNKNKAVSASYPYECRLPPETECEETQFTVVFMAYNPDRLEKLLNQIKKMLTDTNFRSLVAECLIVWNGERHVHETELGKQLIEFSKSHPVRMSYPLKAGFTNDLMNRYHPRLQVKTKAIMVRSLASLRKVGYLLHISPPHTRVCLVRSTTMMMVHFIPTKQHLQDLNCGNEMPMHKLELWLENWIWDHVPWRKARLS